MISPGQSGAAKRRPGLIGPWLATLCSVAKFSGAAKWEPFGGKKKLLPDQIFNGPAGGSSRSRVGRRAGS